MRLLRILGTLATRRRDYELLTQEVASSTDTDRQTILTPRNGFRIRLVRVAVQQHATDGRHLWELFYGSAGNMITAPNRGIDMLAVPDQGLGQHPHLSPEPKPPGRPQRGAKWPVEGDRPGQRPHHHNRVFRGALIHGPRSLPISIRRPHQT